VDALPSVTALACVALAALLALAVWLLIGVRTHSQGASGRTAPAVLTVLIERHPDCHFPAARDGLNPPDRQPRRWSGSC
jgi:hypothetical protein